MEGRRGSGALGRGVGDFPALLVRLFVPILSAHVLVGALSFTINAHLGVGRPRLMMDDLLALD